MDAKEFSNLFQSPGEAIHSLLKGKNWTQEELSDVIGISQKHLNEIIKDKRPISIELAKLLTIVFPPHTAKDWLDLDTNFRLSKAERSRDEDVVKDRAYIYKYMPISEMIKKGWLTNTSSQEELNLEIKTFWNLPKDKELDLSFLDKDISSIHFSKSEAYGEASLYNARIWKQRILNQIRKNDRPSFDKKSFQTLLRNTNFYTVKKNGISLFLKEMEACGVTFAFLPHLNKTYIDGAAFVHEERPVIALSGRYDRSDNFWFTIVHEGCHVLNHLDLKDSDSSFFDDSTVDKSDQQLEKEANDFAAKTLLRNEIIDYFKRDVHYMSDGKIKLFSEYNNIHPSIVVGILAHEQLIHFSKIHRYKEAIRDKIPTKYRVD